MAVGPKGLNNKHVNKSYIKREQCRIYWDQPITQKNWYIIIRTAIIEYKLVNLLFLYFSDVYGHLRKMQKLQNESVYMKFCLK